MPARIKKEAGLLRAFEFRPNAPNGRQTIAGIRVARDQHGEQPGAFNGVIVAHYRSPELLLKRHSVRQLHFIKVPIEQFELISWQGLPASVKEIYVLAVADAFMIPPDKDYPILQTYLDSHYKQNIAYGDDYAREWIETTRGFPVYWLNDREIGRRPWLKCPFYKKIDAMLGCDKAETDRFGMTHRKLPEEFGAAAGIELAEVAQADGEGKSAGAAGASWTEAAALTAKNKDSCICQSTKIQAVDYTGKKLPSAAVENYVFGFGSLINTKSRTASDPQAVDAVPVRILPEVGYARAWNFQSGTAAITALGLEKTGAGNSRPINGIVSPVFASFEELDEREAGYVRVAVPQAQLQTTRWVQVPKGGKVWVYVPKLDGHEPGEGLHMSSYSHPILQTYVDVCLLGCLEQSVEAAVEFITSTAGWDGPWLNDREIARRPWLKQKEYKKIDQLLAEVIPVKFAGRMLPEEMGARMAAMIETHRADVERTCKIAAKWASKAGVATDLERHHHDGHHDHSQHAGWKILKE